MMNSREINSSPNYYRNKYYVGRRMVVQEALQGGREIWFCQIAVRNHDAGTKCPHCGDNPNPSDWSSSLRFRRFDSERQIECEPTVESEGSCSKCKQWWRVTADEGGAVVSFDAPRQSPYQHTFMPHVQYAKETK